MATNYWTGAVSGDWGNTGNWSTVAVPVAGDDVYITNNSVSITASLNQSTITLNSLTIDQSYTGQIAAANTYLQINATTLTIGRPGGGTQSFSGSNRLHVSGTFTTVNVQNTSSSSADTGLPPVCLMGTITTLNALGGSIGLGVLAVTEAPSIATFNVSQNSAATSAPVVTVGTAATVTNYNIDAGTIYHLGSGAVTTADVYGGTYRVQGNSAHTTINVEGGKLIYIGTGTVTNLNVFGNSTADYSNDTRAKTITNCTIYANANLNLATGVKGSVTVTNGIKVSGCDVSGVNLFVGNDRTLALS